MRHALRLTAAAALAWLLAGLAPAGPGGNSFRFSIVGDRYGRAVPGVYERVWREIGQLHPDFVITVGDSIEGHDDRRLAADWGALRTLLAPYRKYPLYFTAGNHDIWSEASRARYEIETGRPPFYGFDFQNAHFTVLDNSRDESLSEEQLLFLEADLKAHRERAPKFVFLHRPYWLVFLKLGSGEFPLHRLAKTYGVNYVISGHGHQFVRLARDGVVYVEVGSSGARIPRETTPGGGFNEGWFYQHVLATVNGPGVRLTVTELGEPYGQGRTLEAGDGEGKQVRRAEAFELCEYGRRPSEAELTAPFPFFE